MMEQTPLRPLHEALGARFTRFGDWEMPLQYAGVIAEHQAVREAVGVFDVSHLGRFRVTGPGARELLRSQLCNDIGELGSGRAQYSMALNEAGGVEDDLIVWWLHDSTFWVLPNGANYDAIMAAFRAASVDGVEIEPLRAESVMLAVQGPESPRVVEQVIGTVPGRFRLASGTFGKAPFVAAGTGYTGERGAEICVPAEAAPGLFEALVGAGATPCGLGARDTLRLEMGYPLWGQDLDPTTTPLEAGLQWVVAWDHEFVGKRALVSQRADGIGRRLIGFCTRDRRVPRHGYRLRAGSSTGVVTSGNFSPVLGHGVGLGYVKPPPAAEDPLEIEARGVWHSVERREPPFVAR